MIIFFGLILVVFSYFESDCPVFSTYYNENDGSCGGVEGCYEIVEATVWECVEDECMYGYTWDGSGCIACSDEGSMTCSDSSTSTSCWDGFYLAGSDCFPCTNEHDDCILCDATECSVCMEGTVLHDGACISCTDNSYPGYDVNAVDCTYSGTEITVTECAEGYTTTQYETTYVWCVPCDESTYFNYDVQASACTSMFDFINVTECKYWNGYCLGDDGFCYDSENVEHDGPCTFDTTDLEFTASECNEGFGLCVDAAGDELCHSCGIDNSDTCTFTDLTCSVVDEYVCKDEGVRYIDSESDSCEDCGEYCGACEYDSGAKCTTCVDTESYERGYYVDGSDVCMPCGDGCAECVDNTVCSSCISTGELGDVCFEEETIIDGDDDDEDDEDDDDGVSVGVYVAIFVPLGFVGFLCLLFGCCFLTLSFLVTLGVVVIVIVVSKSTENKELEKEDEETKEEDEEMNDMEIDDGKEDVTQF